MPRALVTPTMIRNRPGHYSKLLEEAGFEVVWPADEENTIDPAVLVKKLDGVDAILASTEPLNREILAISSLKVVARLGVGYDSVDTAAAADLGIAVTITPGAVDVSVAEHTLALLLGLTRQIALRDLQVRRGVWPRQPMPRLAGKTFGLVGLGRIGKAVVPRVAGLQMNVIAFDPFADERFAAEHNVRLCSTVEEFLSLADVVSLHAPHTPETNDFINSRTLAQMKPGAILINTSRGGLVDEDALCLALEEGRLFGAALDVFKTEPLPTDHRLLKYDNVLTCTHMGGLDEESEEAMSRMAAECVVDLYQGRWPEGRVVNPEVRPHWSWT